MVVLAGSGIAPPRRFLRAPRRRRCSKRVQHVYEAPAQSTCHASVDVFNTDFDEAGEHVVATLVNGQPLHGRCSPGPGYQSCASGIPVDADQSGRLTVHTVATGSVPAASFVGDHVHARHSLSCVQQAYARSGTSRRAKVSVSGLTSRCDLRERTNAVELGIPMGCMGIRKPSIASCRRFYAHGPQQRAEQLELCYYDATADVCRGESYAKCRAPQSCELSVEVWRGGFDAPHKFVRSTLANGVPVHGRCEADPTREGFSRGYFTCATSLPVLPDATGLLELVTEASEALDGPPHEGSLLTVKHTLVCTQVGAARGGDAAFEARHTFRGLDLVLLCVLGVDVYQPAGVTASAPLALSTTANGEEVHGRCSLPRTVVGVDGWFACARRVTLSPSTSGRYQFETNASCAVDENPHDGHELHVRYALECAPTATGDAGLRNGAVRHRVGSAQ